MRHVIVNGFEGLLMDFKKAVNRKREALFLMLLSAVIYVLGFFLKKKFVRVQLLIWLLSAGFLMWFGFRFHNRAIRQIKGCLTGFDFLDHGLDLDVHFYNEAGRDILGANSIYDMGKACLTERSSGNLVDMIRHQDKQAFDWGVRILKGFSHDLKFLETDDVQLESATKFNEILQDFKDYRDGANGKLKGFMSQQRRAVESLNKHVKCFGDQYVFSQEDCIDKVHIYYGYGYNYNIGKDQTACLPVQYVKWSEQEVLQR